MPLMAEETSWIPIRAGEARRDIRAFELVLTARGIDSRVDWREGAWLLLVAPADLSAGESELAAYQRENQHVTRRPPPPRIDSGWWGVAGYLACVWMTMALAASAAFGWDWHGDGRLHVGSVGSGQWWRLATALTLHADLGHIVANSVFGAFFGLLAGRHLGSGLAWLCIVLGGVAGNALNALLRPEQFTSLGASTATFAAVGLVGAFMWRSGFFGVAARGRAVPRSAPASGAALAADRFATNTRGGAHRSGARRSGALAWQRTAAPVFAAIALFAFTGIGDENTDVVAHLTGLAAGFGIGLGVAGLRLQLSGPRAQRFYGLTAAAIVLVAWLLAG